jgi:hypothetical protein
VIGFVRAFIATLAGLGVRQAWRLADENARLRTRLAATEADNAELAYRLSRTVDALAYTRRQLAEVRCEAADLAAISHEALTARVDEAAVRLVDVLADVPDGEGVGDEVEAWLRERGR